MARFQRNLDGEAFERLVATFTAPALGVARQILLDQALAEDAVQEAFLRTVRNRASYQPSRAFSSWFYVILRNVCLDLRRQRETQRQALQELASRPSPAPNGSGDDAEEARHLLAMLPKAERDVLKLRIVDGLAFKDIAAALGVSQEAAKKRAQRGLQRLREKLTAPVRVTRLEAAWAADAR